MELRLERPGQDETLHRAVLGFGFRQYPARVRAQQLLRARDADARKSRQFYREEGRAVRPDPGHVPALVLAHRVGEGIELLARQGADRDKSDRAVRLGRGGLDPAATIIGAFLAL